MNSALCSSVSLINLGIRQKSNNINLAYNRINLMLCKFLYEHGFIHSYYVINQNNIDNKINIKMSIILNFKFYGNKQVLYSINMISKPGFKRYWSYKYLHMKWHMGYFNHSDIYLLSTNRGLLSVHDCIKYKIGGLIIAKLN